MKKVIKKYWGIALVIMLMSSLFVSAAPVSAAEPLNWEMQMGGPSPMFNGMVAGTDIVDIAIGNDGMTMYAITHSYVSVTATIAVAYTTGDTYTFDYVNQDGVLQVGAGTVTVGLGIAGTAYPVTLAPGDTGVLSIPTQAAGVLATGVAGSFTFSAINAATTVIATCTTGGAVVAVANSPVVSALYKTTNAGGQSWVDISAKVNITGAALVTFDYVAVAPDDPNVVAVLDATAAGIKGAISNNGGAVFSGLGTIQDAAGTPANTAYGIEISAQAAGGVRYIAIPGAEAVTPQAALYFYNFGAAVGTWRDAVVDFLALGGTNLTIVQEDFFKGFAFSPNFPSDYMAVAISEDTGGAGLTGALDLHVLSFNAFKWDAGYLAGSAYPVEIDTAALGVAFGANSVSIALLPEYDGGDESLRIAMVGASITSPALTETGGLWRVIDDTPAVPLTSTTAPIGFNSIAFDGTNLAAGAYASNNVYRCSDPLANSPTVLPARGYKKIGLDTAGVNEMTLVAFSGETLYGATRGAASAFSKSTDYGYTWNDYTLIDGATTTIDDIYMSPAGDPWYMAANDGAEASIYRVSMWAPVRVLCVPVATAAAFMLEGVADDSGVIYAADKGATAMFYTDDGGLNRWKARNAPAAVADIAAESKEVVYVGSATSLYKSTNSAFTWSVPMDTKLSAAIYMLLSVSENNLVASAINGDIHWTTDGGTSWVETFGLFLPRAVGNTFVAATGLGSGDYIFATDTLGLEVYRCAIDDPFHQFLTMNLENQPGVPIVAELPTGLLLTDGILYVMAYDPAGPESYLYRTSAPAIPGTHAALFWGAPYPNATGLADNAVAFNQTPNSIKASAGMPGSINIYAIDTIGMFGADVIYYFDDSVVLNGPALIGPDNDTRIDVISSLLGNVQNVNFTWSRLSKSTSYNLFVALDEGFTEAVWFPTAVAGVNLPFIAVVSSFDPVSQIVSGANFVPGTTYYWRVAASVPIGSGFSETRSFIVQPTAATVPTISSPENGGSISSTSPAFSWTPVSGATMYQFQLSASPDFATTLVDEELTTAGIMPSVVLEKGGTYFWRVKALQPVDGDWSTVSNFMVAAEAPAPTPPVVIETVPPPVIEIPPAQPAPIIEIPPAPAPEKIAPAYIWAIIIIGAVLVIAVIVLIVRTRRSV